MRPHGRARVNASAPQAFAICDRCGFQTNHFKLRWQYEWTGPSLYNKRLLVCDPCYDTPNEQLRTILLSPDPTPIINARPENYAVAEA